MKSSQLRASASSAPEHFRFLPQVALLSILITSMAGCASRNVLIVARANPAYFISTTNLFCLAGGNAASPGEAALIPALSNQLRVMSIEVVPLPEADYSIACWMDVSHERIAPYHGHATVPDPFTSYDANRMTVFTGPAAISRSELITSTIRIRIYPTRLDDARRLAPAWDAFADAGIRVSEDRANKVLKAMLQYLGQDFEGSVNLDHTEQQIVPAS